MKRHELTFASKLNDKGMTIIATCQRCKKQHVKHFSPEAVARIAFKPETRTTTGIENEMDRTPCAPEQMMA